MTAKAVKQGHSAKGSLIEAAQRVMREGRPLLVKSRGASLAMVVPMDQYRLTQAFVRKLQDESDAAHTHAALTDTDLSAWSSLDDVRKELGLDRKRSQVRKKGAAQTATRPRGKAARRR